MEKRAILHIGSNKTGSTYLQAALHRSREQLEIQGFSYPGEEQCHQFLYFTAQRPREMWPRLLAAMPPEELQENIERALTGFTRDLARPLPAHILSSEYLFFADPTAIDNVLSFLRSLVDRIEVVAFIRQPSSHYASFQQQRVKASHVLTAPREYRYPIREVLENWEKRVDELHVLKYERETDPVTAFGRAIGLDPQAITQPGERINEAISVEQMAVLQHLQRLLYRDQADIPKPHLYLIQNLRPRGLTPAELRHDIAEIVDQRHAADLAWLRERFGIDFGVDTRRREVPAHVKEEAELKEPRVEDLYYLEKESEAIYRDWLLDSLLRQFTRGAS